MEDGLITGADGYKRCFWCGDDPLYVRYHDEEWGWSNKDNFHLFEKISLEGFQSGLSWITILRKRENFRAAFDHFDFYKIARYSQSDIERLVQNAGIIRHRGKIEAVINNAQRAIEMVEHEGSLADFFWRYAPSPASRPKIMNYQAVRSLGKTEESTALSKELKKRGWKFVGPTTCYAFMQSEGIVNDHLEGCHSRGKVNR